MRRFRPRRAALIAAATGLVLSAGLSISRIGRAGGSASRDVAAPALKGSDWINVPAADVDWVSSFKGRVTLLHFWTFECINCKHDLPAYARWAAAYKPTEVQVIGIHTPELAEERVPENVRAAVKSLGISYPILIDGEGTNWNRYQQKYWPTVYVIDKKGNVRYHWVGELGYNGQDGYRAVTRVVEQLQKEG